MSDKNEEQEQILKNYVNSTESVNAPVNAPVIEQVGPKITDTKDTPLPWEKQTPAFGNLIGWIPIKLEDLPTRGLFYPKETKMLIRSANGGEIRHWSTLSEDPTNINYYSQLDDMLNYIIERCVTFKSNDINISWKDIKEVDRFYILLAIHELTFPEGENKLQVKVSEDKKIDVIKDMVHYITLDPKLMQYYDEIERCFVLKFKGGKTIKLDLPCVGVTQFIKNYIQRKRAQEEYFEEDYVTYAPFIIRSWRGLNDSLYNNYVQESHSWDNKTISLLAYFKQTFSDAIDPVIRYTDEGGMEQVAPLNFQGGIKSIFLISDPFGELE